MAIGGNNQTLSVTIGANMDPSGVLSAVKQMQSAFSGLKLPGDIGANLEKSFGKATDLLKKYQTQLSKGINTKTDAKNITKTGSQINEVLDEIVTHINSINGQQIFLKADVSGLNTLKTNIENARTAWKNAIQEFRKGSDIEKVLNEIAEKTTRSNLTQGSISSAKTLFDKGDLEGYRNALDDIYNRLKHLKDTTIKNVVENLGLQDAGSKVANLEQIKKRLEDISKIDFSEDSNVDTKFKAITTAVTEYETEVKRASQAGQNAFNNINVDKTVKNTRDLVDATDQYKNSVMSAKDQVQQLQQSTQYFFSLRNMINLLKRGIDEAVQSVKDLDKAMTETAVVTDYKVSDLWGMLPEYTKVANQLGATTQGAYETMTLYYQQGLEQQQAFELGAETMKMARIAGLDYAETTDMMTAALRGFNMELNETSAKRVNDVYSELAAITASDTEELGTAMQRTASIAASAGASFEGTTAFLAQAIETTREPAENIGTAMKTIVARFQEMKKNPLEISEVEGEEVDYNKIDAALKSIGVDLKDTNGQFREFDQVMLDISAKWDTLSQSQQRYIATTAAGSRQQSRFIAMVSNYDRTMQLMEAANNSAGASDEQFGKTMDSLESKLNQLHNAWQQFTMGIANNGMIKLAVDGLTGFLNITNKIIDTLSMGSGAIKSFLSIFTAFTGLKMAGRGANALIGGLGGLVDPQSSVKEGLKIGLFGQGKTNAQAKAITTPIVASLNKISQQIAQIKNGSLKGDNKDLRKTSAQQYLDVKKQFDKLGGQNGFTMNEASGLFGQLDAKHQQAMFNNSPGTKAAMKKASMAWFNAKGLSPELTKEGQLYINSIYKGMKEGQIPVDKGVELIGQPQKWGKYFGTETALAYSKSFIQESKPAMEASRQTAHEAAIASLGFNPEDYKVGSKELRGLLNDKNNEQIKKEYAALYSGFRGDLDSFEGHGGAKGKVSDLGHLANDIGSIGDKFTQAGYGISTFGNALSQLGGPIGAIGSGIAAFGGAVSSMGMMVSGATSLITVFSEGIQIAGTSIAISGGAIAAVVGPLAAAAAAFLLVRAHLKKVKEAGEEVTNTFKETSKSAEDNVAKLKSYQSEFAQLSKGVDSNGYNVSLDDSQYQRYLEIVDDIAAINPDIVEGYNAQGHAIINNNKALEETLKKQQQIKDEAYDTYTSEDSLQKLINARNINNDFKAINVKGESPSVYDGSGHGSEGRQKPVGLGRDVFNIVDQLRLNKDFDESSLQKYGIDSLDSLINGEEQAVKNFIKHRQQIQADLTNSGLELNESIIKGFDKLGEDSAAFDAAIKPIYDNLLANVSNSKVFESIAPEFREALNMGLKDLASQDLNASDMAKAASNMAQKFANLTSEGSDYAKALDAVEEAQQDFASTLDETQYEADVQPAINELTRLKEAALSEGGAYGDALAEYLENQIQRISRFTEESGANLSEALNTATDDIAAAESALENFNNSTKSDYWTAAEGMKSIYDKATETFKDSFGSEWEKHFEGHGDKTAWEAGRALFGEDALEGISADKLRQKFKEWEPALREGEEGWYNFWQKVTGDSQLMENLNAIDGVHWDEDDFYIPEDKWAEVARTIGISEDMLTAMLNKGRQFADISFANWGDVRKAFATSDTTIKGTSAGEGQEQNLYVKKDTWEQALGDAGYTPEQYYSKENEKNRKKQNIQLLDINNSTKTLRKQFDDMGVKTLPDLIKTLAQTGDFTKDEIQEYAEKLSLLNGEDYDQLYADTVERLENPELAKQTDKLGTIEGYTSDILSYLNRNSVRDGHLDNPLAEQGKQLLEGKAGVIDTKYEWFARGKNESGQNISNQEYSDTEAELKTLKSRWQSYLSDVEEGIQTAQKNGNTEQAIALEKEKAGIEANIAAADELLNKAKSAKKELETREKTKKDKKEKENNPEQPQNAQRTARTPEPKSTPNVPQPEAPTAPKGQFKNQTVDITYKAKEDTSWKKAQHHAEQLAEQDGKEINVDLQANYEKVQEAQQAEEELTDKTVTIATKENLEGAQTVIKSLGEISDKTVAVKTEGDTSGAVAVKNAIANVVGKTVSIGTELGNTAAIKTIDDKISALARKGNNIKIGTTVYKGQNNKIPYHSLPSFGSAARGRYGTVGPKNKGGLTLTGEKGFEIAWLPSENRSMILGAGGPQMLNLPADAVVYSHEQSKDILKRKGIPAGSHSADTKGQYDASSSKYANTTVINNYYQSNNDKGGKGGKGKDKTDNKVKATSKKVYQWWEKISRQVKAVERKANKLGDKLTKTFNDIRASIDDISEANKDFIKAQKKSIELNQSIVNTYTKKLTNLNKNGKASRTTIKYKKGKKEKTAHVNIGKFIKYDSDTGQYYVDKKAINAKTKDSKAKRRAIRDKAYELIDKYQDRRDEAQDAVDKAKEELADYRKEINDTFFDWENELTQVLRITSEIEKTEARINQKQAERDRTEFYMDNLDFSRGAINATSGGHSFNNLWTNYSSQITQNIKLNEEEIKLKNEQIKANKEEMQAAADLTDSLVTYADINGDIKQESEKDMYDRIKTIAEESGTGTGWDELSTQEKQIFARKEFFRRGLVTGNAEEGYALNEDALNTYLKDIKNGKIQSELGDLFKSIFDTLNEKTLENIQLGTEAYELETDNLKLEQERLDKAKDISEQLYGWKNTLTKILELTNKIEQSEKRTSLLKSGQDYYAAKQKASYGVSSTDILGTYVGQMVSTINQIQDRSELLRRQQEDLQKYIAGQDIETELANLRSKPQTEIEKARIETLEEEAKIRQKAQRYITTKTNADGTIAIEFNTELFEQEKGDEYDNVTAPKIEEYVQELTNKNNEIADTMAANLSDITELYTALVDLRQEYADRAKELREAYGAQQQKVIDNLKNLYSAIDNSFKELINQVKQSIQQRRQVEDNAKTEQDISKKQQRLASLRANTAGGNQVAIAQLEKEIADAQQSYGRTLEDQLLDKVSQQGDLAAKQREQQIQLMQAQRDWAAKTGKDAEEINQWLQNPEKYKSNITAVLQSEAGWAAMATAEQTVFNSSLDAKLADLKTLPEKINTTSATLATIKPAIEATEKNIKDTTKTAIDNIPTETLKVFNTNIKSLDGKIEVANSGIEAVAKKLDNELAKKIETDKKKKEEEEKAKKKEEEAKKKEEEGKKKKEEENKKKKEEERKHQEEERKRREEERKRQEKERKRQEEAEKRAKLNKHQKQLSDYSNQLADAQVRLGMAKQSGNSRRIKTAERDLATIQQDAQKYVKTHNSTPEEQYYNFLFSRGNKFATGDKYWGEIGKTGLVNIFETGSKFGLEPGEIAYDLAKTKALTWREIFKAAIKANYTEEEVKLWRDYVTTDDDKNNFGKAYNTIFKPKKKLITNFPIEAGKKKKYETYKTGGLANYTGPAWLDGTPSKPELILNATDTQNFLALRDILSKAIGSTNSITNSYGGNATYEININVDKIEKDYDVDRVVEKVKKEIVKGSGYRNVTQVRNFK